MCFINKKRNIFIFSCSIHSIPTISVVKKDNKWYTADNRRLWVFRNLERLGKCNEIRVTEGYYIPSSKFTTYNGGESVVVRNGSPGGNWYRKPSVKKPPPSKPAIVIPPTPTKDDNKENIPAKPTAVNDTINKASRSPFRHLDWGALEIHDENKSMKSEINKADSVKVTEPVTSFWVAPRNTKPAETQPSGYISRLIPLPVDKSSSDERQEIPPSGYISRLIPLPVDKSPSDERQEIPVKQQEDYIMKEDSCHVEVDEDNNNIKNKNASFMFDAGSIEADPENCTNKIVKKISRKCIAAIVATVIIAAVVLIVIIVCSV